MLTPPLKVKETSGELDPKYKARIKQSLVSLLALASMVLVTVGAFQCGHWVGEGHAMSKAAIPTVNLLYDHAKLGTLDHPGNRELAPSYALEELQRRDEDFGKVRSFEIVKSTGDMGGSAYIRVKTNREGVDYIETVYWTSPEKKLKLGSIEKAEDSEEEQAFK